MKIEDLNTQIVNFITSPGLTVDSFWDVLKIVFLFGFGLYVAFAFLVIRQIHMMTKTFQTSAEPLLKLFGYLHFAFAIVVFFFVFTVL